MKTVFIALIRLYQVTIAHLVPPNTCRFYPTCSNYAIDALRKHGAAKGLWRSVRRVARCHPLHPGGYDPA